MNLGLCFFTIVLALSFGTAAGVPLLSIEDASGYEGIPLTFIVTLSYPVDYIVYVDYETEQVSATSNVDYQPKTGNVVFPPGSTTQPANVSIIEDPIYEGDETFKVKLKDAVGATIERGEAIGTIRDDDTNVVSIVAVDAINPEGDFGTTTFIFAVYLSSPTRDIVIVEYTTVGGTAASFGGIDAVSGVVTFSPGSVEETVYIDVFGDIEVESDEEFQVRLLHPTGATIDPSKGEATGIILNDDFDDVDDPPDDDCKTASCLADPHFLTWNGTWFDYQGQCDLVLLQNEDLDMFIHIRTTIRYQYSFVESLALMIGGDVLEVDSFGSYRLNGVESANSWPFIMAGMHLLTHDIVDQNRTHFVLDLGGPQDRKEQLFISTHKDMVSIKIENATKRNFGKSLGLMGRYEDGAMLSRDGATDLGDDPNAFGQEWQVTDTEPKLFDRVVRSPQAPATCILPSATSAENRRLGQGSVTVDGAAAACSSLGALKDLCIKDVLATQDTGAADAFTWN